MQNSHTTRAFSFGWEEIVVIVVVVVVVVVVSTNRSVESACSVVEQELSYRKSDE